MFEEKVPVYVLAEREFSKKEIHPQLTHACYLRKKYS